MFHMPNRAKLSRTRAGFVVLGITLLVYGATELVGGYVFVAALALRAAEREHEYHEKLYDFAEELERLLMMVLLGGAVAPGRLLREADVWVIAFAAVAIFIVRPLAGWIALWGSCRPPEERATIAFYGIRGLGSFYYLAFALGHAEFQAAGTLWATVTTVVLISVFLHGTTVTPAMAALDRRRGGEQLDLLLQKTASDRVPR
jgi:NhaP-type Na+/H+ or K+/H+ antiporter